MGGAYAGHWTTTYTPVGNWVTHGPNNANLASDLYGVSGSGAQGTVGTGGGIWMGFFWLFFGGSGGASCSGQVTATLTWVPANGNWALDPAPPVAFVKETSSASFSGTGGACDPGFSDNLQTNSTTPDDWGFYSVQKSAVRYHVKTAPGNSFTVTCTPTASASAPGMPGGESSVTYKVEAWPVNIAVGGTTADPGDDRPKILPGQKVTGVVVYGDGAPLTPALVAGVSPPKHDTTWTISGCNPFLDFVVASGGATGTLTTYSSQQGATGWAFWAKPGTGTVACEHKMKLTEGPQTVFTVGLQKTVPVVDVDKTAIAFAQNPGAMYEEAVKNGNLMRIVRFSHARFEGAVTTPTFFHVASDKGSWDFVQLIRTSERRWRRNGQLHLEPDNIYGGAPRLDNQFPYDPGAVADGTNGFAIDAPAYGKPKAWVDLEHIWFKDEFTMFWIYRPPQVEGSEVRYVPMAKCDWACGVKASESSWTPEGTIEVPPSYVPSVIGSVNWWPGHPVWTQVVTD